MSNGEQPRGGAAWSIRTPTCLPCGRGSHHAQRDHCDRFDRWGREQPAMLAFAQHGGRVCGESRTVQLDAVLDHRFRRAVGEVDGD